jgi:hypothetical protein
MFGRGVTRGAVHKLGPDGMGWCWDNGHTVVRFSWRSFSYFSGCFDIDDMAIDMMR